MIVAIHSDFVYYNPSTTTRVKISQNVDILAKVYLVYLTSYYYKGQNRSKSVKMLIYLPRSI